MSKILLEKRYIRLRENSSSVCEGQQALSLKISIRPVSGLFLSSVADSIGWVLEADSCLYPVPAIPGSADQQG